MNISHESAVDAVITKAVEIGASLPESVRPFYVAYCYQLQMLGEHVWPMIGMQLGVNELSEEARLFAEWGDATVAEDLQKCEEIEARIDGAGFHDECIQAIDASARLARALPSLLRFLPASEALH